MQQNKLKELKFKLKEKYNEDASILASTYNDNNNISHYNDLKLEILNLETNYSKVEKQYKSKTAKLLKETKNFDKANLTKEEIELINNLHEEENQESAAEEGHLNQENDKNLNNSEECSLIKELKEFKKQPFLNYKFEIPLKYTIHPSTKVISEETKENKRIVKFYENKVIEVVSKSNIARVKY